MAGKIKVPSELIPSQSNKIMLRSKYIYDDVKGHTQEEINAALEEQIESKVIEAGGVNWDVVPTAGSNNAIKSKDIKAALEKVTGYFVLDSNVTESTVAKTVTVADFPALALGGSIKIKMLTKNTAANPTLKIGPASATAYPLYYNEERASANNSWEANEIISVFFDGANYRASNSQGGSNKKIDAYLLGDLRTLAVGQTYEEDEAVKTIDKQLLRINKKVDSMNLTDEVAVGDLKAVTSGTNLGTYQAQKAINAYSDSEYTIGDYAIGSPAGAVIQIAVDNTAIAALEEATDITITIAGIEIVVTVDSTMDAVGVAAAIVTAFGTQNEWKLTDNEDGTLTLISKVAKTTAPTISSETGETGVTVGFVADSDYAGSVTLSKYDGASWNVATLEEYAADSAVWNSVDITWLSDFANSVVKQNSIAKELDVNEYATYLFEKGSLTDSGKNEDGASGKYMRTPASTPITIREGETLEVSLLYKNASGGTMVNVTTRFFEYLNGTFIRRITPTSIKELITCDGSFNQIRVRAYKDSVSFNPNYLYSKVECKVEHTLKEVRAQGIENTQDIIKLKKVADVVTDIEGETINKRVFTYKNWDSDIYYKKNESGSYVFEYYHNKCGGIKLPVKKGDHVELYTAGTTTCRPYILADEYRKVIAVAVGSNFSVTPAVFDVTRDCYLYANMYFGDYSKSIFKLTITSSPSQQYEGHSEDIKTLDYRAPMFRNNPYPIYKDTLKILCIGNSFAEDSTEFVRQLISAAGLDASKVCCYVLYNDGASLANYATWYNNGQTFPNSNINTNRSYVRRFGSITMTPADRTLKGIVNQNWDIITLQQVSYGAYNWNSYNPYLRQLVSHIKEDCPKACIGWLTAWSTHYYSTEYAPDFDKILPINAMNARRVWNEIGIDFMIPVGVAIENARNTSLNNSADLLRDGRHLDLGIGRYIAGCCFFEAVLASFYGLSVIGNSLTVSSGTPVTDSNKKLCQQCAHEAIVNMWEVTTGLEHTVTFKDEETVISETVGVPGTDITIPENPEKEGYTFTGWSTDGSTIVTPVSTVGNVDITYVAVWEAIEP